MKKVTKGKVEVVYSVRRIVDNTDEAIERAEEEIAEEVAGDYTKDLVADTCVVHVIRRAGKK